MQTLLDLSSQSSDASPSFETVFGIKDARAGQQKDNLTGLTKVKQEVVRAYQLSHKYVLLGI